MSCRRVLVANRGEIARRVFRTCRTLGLGTVAVFSDADADAPHVREADAAVHLPGVTPSDTYLRADLLIEAAHRAGADAIHPGYGFLSENAAFAREVIAAGLTWIGPPAEAIDAMGSKIEAKRRMAAAGVPVLTALDPGAIAADDLPVLVKASAGGGGRGMRVVTDVAQLPDELALARAEAQSAFGDGAVFCEPYLPAAHHVEVQIVADKHGVIWPVGERECSIQRRHQKVIEEAPSPLVERVPAMREQLFAAAVDAAKAVDYAGAGTVEFLADEQGRFYFLEMNTRLQVEHPVTECTTGLDLVALQIAIADGGRLDGNPPPTQGHAIEARLYAEDPAADWQPQSGALHALHVPERSTEFEVGITSHGIRLDAGVVDSADVSVHYDPMLAKVIAWAPNRAEAAAALAMTLARSAVHGIRTNRDLLVNVLRHKAFLDRDTDTAFFDRHGLDVLAAPLVADREPAALAAALAMDAGLPRILEVPSGWRNVFSQPQTITLDDRDVHYRLTRDGLETDAHVELVSAAPHEVVLCVHGVQRRYSVTRYGDIVHVDTCDGGVSFRITPRFADAGGGQVAAGSLLAPMPGSVVRIGAQVGDVVAAGAPVLWLEAMKMQHQVNAPVAGVISELRVGVGQQVDVDTVLAVITEE